MHSRESRRDSSETRSRGTNFDVDSHESFDIDSHESFDVHSR